MQKNIITLAGAAMLFVAGEGRAQNSPVLVEGGVPTAVVSYADLNITSEPGRLALERRVERAASGLCLDYVRAPVEDLIVRHQCYSTAMTRARIDIQQAVARARNDFAMEGAIRVAAK
jgi:UrcA family protein